MTRISSAMRVAIVGVTFAMITLASQAHAQAPDPNDPGFTLVVAPTTIPTNGRVTLSGLGIPDPHLQIHITITGPSGTPSTLLTSPAANGRYSIGFGGTQAQGKYTVTAQFGTEGKLLHGEFTVKTYLINFNENIEKSKALLVADSSLVEHLKKALDNISGSPTKEDMSKKLDELKKQTDKGPAQAASLAKITQPFVQLVQSHPETMPFVQPLFNHLNALSEEATKTTQQINAEIEGSKTKLNDCDQIDHMTESLKTVPEAFSAALEPFDFILGFARNIANQVAPPGSGSAVNAAAEAADLAHSLNDARKGEDNAESWEKAQVAAKTALAKNEIETGMETKYGEKLAASIPASLKSNPGYKLAVSEIKKFLPQLVAGNAEPQKLFQMGSKLASDILAFGSNQLFSKFCQKFAGEFTATMTAHFFSTSSGADGIPVEWWTFSTAIKGRMTLRYPKAASSTAVQLSGQLEGGATKFTYKEDVFNTVLFGRMMKGGVVHKIDLAPVATDNGEGGAFNGMTSATSFYIPLSGTLVGNKIVVTMEPSRADFNQAYTKAHTVYAVIAPTTLGLPVWGHFELPYMNAHFIFEHLIKDGDDHRFAVERKGDKMIIERKQDKTLPGNGNSATYTLELKACNPECQ